MLFFRAILKFIVILLKKSLFHSSFNFTKFLLKLNPIEDPVGALIMMDHVALLAKKFDWLQSFIITYGSDYVTQGTSLLLYPNYIYSYALCLFEKKFGNESLEKLPKLLCKVDSKVIE